MSIIKPVIFFAALVVSAQAQLSPPEYGLPLSKRNDCHADNALRNFRDKRYSSSASIFCSGWLQSTFTNTISVTATASATTTYTPEAKTATLTIPVTITKTETTFTTVYPTAVNTFVKRGEIPYPPWLSASFPPSRVSSACSCFITSPSAPATVCQTTTVATVTNTETTTLEPLTNTETKFLTATASATETSVITGPSIPCDVPGCASGDGFLDRSYPDSLAACKAYCQANADCKSFEYGVIDSETNFCSIFDVEVDEAFAVGSSMEEGCLQWRFYDVRCVV